MLPLIQWMVNTLGTLIYPNFNICICIEAVIFLWSFSESFKFPQLLKHPCLAVPWWLYRTLANGAIFGKRPRVCVCICEQHLWKWAVNVILRSAVITTISSPRVLNEIHRANAVACCWSINKLNYESLRPNLFTWRRAWCGEQKQCYNIDNLLN